MSYKCSTILGVITWVVTTWCFEVVTMVINSSKHHLADLGVVSITIQG